MIKRLLRLIIACLKPWKLIQRKHQRQTHSTAKSKAFLSREQQPQASEARSPDRITYSLPRNEVVASLNRTFKHGKINRHNIATPPSPHPEANTAELIPEEERPSLIRSLADSAYLCECQGRLSKAEKLYQQALTLSIHHFGEGHLEPAQLRCELAKFYYRQQRYAHALPLLEQTLNIQQQHQAIHYPDHGETLYQLANIYRSLENYAKAEALYQQALSIFRSSFGSEHELTQAAYSELIQMLTKVIAAGQFEALTSELSPLDLETLSDTYSWAKPAWMRSSPTSEDYSWIKLYSPPSNKTSKEAQ